MTTLLSPAPRRALLDLTRDRCQVVGVLSFLDVTPDSFSDGGRYVDGAAGTRAAARLAAEWGP
jgi:dihydropteroate synthase